jgi:hypothetical protein
VIEKQNIVLIHRSIMGTTGFFLFLGGGISPPPTSICHHLLFYSLTLYGDLRLDFMIPKDFPVVAAYL